MKKVFRISPLILAAIILFLVVGCKKEELFKSSVLESEFSSDSLYYKNTSVKDSGNLGNPVAIDADGNIYTSVTIGTQIWMAENLKTTKYRNGDIIGTTKYATQYIYAEESPKYQWAFDGDESKVATYGRLYTWYAATDSRSVCPTGWHLPTGAEMNILTTFLGGENIAGGKLKGESGFTPLPGGWRDVRGYFWEIGISGQWWSSTRHGPDNAWYRYLRWDSAGGLDWDNRLGISFQGVTQDGFSVRCIKDNDSTENAASGDAPFVSNDYATNISETGVTLNGIVNANSSLSKVTFEYGATSNYEEEVTPEQSPVTGNADTYVNATLTGLTCGIIYHYRVKAENLFGISYSDDETFHPIHKLILTTTPISGITDTIAILEGYITDDGGAAIIDRGFYVTGLKGVLPPGGIGRGEITMPRYNTTHDGIGTGSFTHNLTGLRRGSTYYAQAYAINSEGRKGLGNLISFTTSGK